MIKFNIKSNIKFSVFIKCICLMFLLTLNMNITRAADIQNIIDEQYQAVKADLPDHVLDSLQVGDMLDSFPEFDLQALIEGVTTGNLDISADGVLSRALDIFLNQVRIAMGVFTQIIILAVLSVLVDRLRHSLNDGGASDAAFYACYLVIASTATVGFTSMVSSAVTALDDLVEFIYAIYPMLFTLVASSGGVISAAVLSPVLLSWAQLVMVLIKQVFVPLLMVATALGLASNISRDLKVYRTVSLINSVIKWALCLVLAVFVGIVSIQSAISSSLDSVTARTTKYVARTVPVVGGLLSDSFEVVVGSAVLLKNAVGIAGMIVIVLMVFTPVARIFAHSFLLHLTAAVIEPVADGRIVDCISGLANSLMLVFAMLGTAAVMFLVNIAVIINSGVSVGG